MWGKEQPVQGLPARQQMTPLPRLPLEMTQRAFATYATDFGGTFLHPVTTRQTLDEALLMSVCGITDTVSTQKS